MIGSEKIQKFLAVSSIINSALEPDEVVRRTIEYTPEVFDSEAASLLLVDDEREELYFTVATGDKGEAVKEIRLRIGEGVAGWVAKHKQPLIVNDTQSDKRFFKQADEKSGFVTRNILCVPVLLKEQLTGVLEVLNKADGGYTEEDLTLLKALSDQVAVALENARLYKELKDTFYSTVETLAEMIELRDPYTGGHTQRVKEYSLVIGQKLGLDKDSLEHLQLAAVLHDVGKIGIRDAVLLKQARLDDEEFKLMCQHAEFGARVLEHIRTLEAVIPGIKYHHERYDGKGYPERLKNGEIPLIARIIAVADTYDAMTTTRPYRKGLSPEVAIEELKRHAGTQFDPQVVEAFVQAYEEGMIKNET